MRRVITTLQSKPVRWVAQNGTVAEFTVSVSVGVSEFQSATDVQSAFDQADAAAYASKKSGRGSVTRATSLPADGQ